MPQHYFDLRTQAARGTDSIIADMMRHLHTRQHLGTALVIGLEPMVLLSAARKQWLRIARSIQIQRASTLNADKILKYTHTITRMQHMEFTPKQPHERPRDSVFFLRPNEVELLPPGCYTAYTNAAVPRETAERLARQLPASALVVDYAHETPWESFGLQPKSELEATVAKSWQDVQLFLQKYNIKIGELVGGTLQTMEELDDALDTLLEVSHSFLEIAGVFQRALELSRPLRLSKATREEYDAVALLAHRVQALSPGAFQQQFLEVYNEDDSFFLLDNAFGANTEVLARRIRDHQRAGRLRLATALALHPRYAQPIAKPKPALAQPPTMREGR